MGLLGNCRICYKAIDADIAGVVDVELANISAPCSLIVTLLMDVHLRNPRAPKCRVERRLQLSAEAEHFLDLSDFEICCTSAG